jgi:hypothetical protein
MCQWKKTWHKKCHHNAEVLVQCQVVKAGGKCTTPIDITEPTTQVDTDNVCPNCVKKVSIHAGEEENAASHISGYDRFGVNHGEGSDPA